MNIVKSIRKVLYFFYNKTIRHNKNEYPLIIYNDLIGHNVIFFDYFEKDLVESIFNSLSLNVFDNVCIDVGANIGNHSVQYSKAFKKVISFEPQKRTFKILDLNTNVYPNINIFNFGLSNINKQLTFKIPFKNIGGANQMAKGEGYYEETVHFKVYDQIFNEIISYVKIDVEGNEIEVLKGMEKSILKYLPIISFELNQDIKKNREILNYLIVLGYDEFYIKKEHFIDKLFESTTIITQFIKFIVKQITYPAKNILVKKNISEILTNKRYDLITVVNNNSKYNIAKFDYS